MTLKLEGVSKAVSGQTHIYPTDLTLEKGTPGTRALIEAAREGDLTGCQDALVEARGAGARRLGEAFRQAEGSIDDYSFDEAVELLEPLLEELKRG